MLFPGAGNKNPALMALLVPPPPPAPPSDPSSHLLPTEAIVRGHRAGFLTAADYNNLCQCESLDDIKLHLTGTDYGTYLQNEPSPLSTTTIVAKCTEKLVDVSVHLVDSSSNL